MKPKIEFYRTRTLSEKLSDTMSFLRENWKPILKYFFYLMLPVSLLLAFFMNHFMGIYMKMTTDFDLEDEELLSMGFYLLGLGIVTVVGYCLLAALVFALIRLYRIRPNRLEDLQYDELKPELMHCIKRSAVLTLSLVGFVCILIAIAAVVIVAFSLVHLALGVLSALVIYVVILVGIIMASLVEPIYMMEDETGLMPAYQKAFRLGWHTFGGILAVNIIIGLLANVLQTFTTMPWYAIYVIKMVFTLSNDLDGSVFNTFWFTIIEYLTAVLECIGMLLSMVITTVGLAVQYGHASDKIDGVGVAQKIERFDEFDNF